jgi:hypothetical protein
MGKITVDNGGELKPTQGLTYPRLEVAFDARIMQYKILRYRDDRTTSTDQVNTPARLEPTARRPGSLKSSTPGSADTRPFVKWGHSGVSELCHPWACSYSDK